MKPARGEHHVGIEGDTVHRRWEARHAPDRRSPPLHVVYVDACPRRVTRARQQTAWSPCAAAAAAAAAHVEELGVWLARAWAGELLDRDARDVGHGRHEFGRSDATVMY